MGHSSRTNPTPRTPRPLFAFSGRLGRPSKVARQTTFGSMAVVGGGHMPGLGWTLQRHGVLVTAPLDSLGGPRRNAAQIRASANPLFEQLDPALSCPLSPKRIKIHWLQN